MLPREVQDQILEKKIRVYVIDADQVARDMGVGNRINTVMQPCFFVLSGVLPREQAFESIKRAIERTYGPRGPLLVQRNLAAVDAALAHLHEAVVPATVTSQMTKPAPVPSTAPPFVQKVTAALLEGRGDELPVSALPFDGTYPTGTARYEKRGRSRPRSHSREPRICIQCGKRALVCPHAVIRLKICEARALEQAPPGFQYDEYKGSEHEGMKLTIQVSPDYCTGCGLCVEVCPACDKLEPRRKALRMVRRGDLAATDRESYQFLVDLPELDRRQLRFDSVKRSQVLEPRSEYSGACAGCGEAPYLKLLSQLFGDRALIANATGCSSIYGGNLPTTPWSTNREGRGPAWNNSLFEDAAEFGLGFHVALDAQRAHAEQLLGEACGGARRGPREGGPRSSAAP